MPSTRFIMKYVLAKKKYSLKTFSKIFFFSKPGISIKQLNKTFVLKRAMSKLGLRSHPAFCLSVSAHVQLSVETMCAHV